MYKCASVHRQLFLAAVITFAAVSAFGSDAVAPHKADAQIEPVVQQLASDIKLITYANGVQVEQLRSNAALTHLQKAMLRHPQAFALSRAYMLARGFVPSKEVFVERTYHLAKNRQQRNDNQYYLAQTSSEQNSDGEIIFYSYDGPGDAWQGTIYVEFYASGLASTWDGQIDTTSEDYPYNWITQTWSTLGNGGQDFLGSWHPPLPGTMNRAAEIQFADWKAGKNQVSPVSMDWLNWSLCWRASVVGGCATAAIGCIRSAAAWPACFATWCIGIQIGTAITCGIVYYR
jgi:hypothetical protein